MLLHYDFIAEFKRQFYKDLLTADHVESGLIELPKLTYENGTEENGTFWGWILKKNGINYLLSYRDVNDNVRDINELLPIRPNDCIEVSSKGIVYKWIHKPVTMKIRPVKTMTFKQMVDKFCMFAHTNQVHQKLMWFMGLTQMLDRANFRISTPAGFGKDSTVDILGNLVGGAATLENPTLAKLEFMTSFKWLAVNEVVDVSPSEWRIIEQFLLATGAHKSEVTKHSRAVSGTKEILNTSHFSLSLMYNDIDHYPDMEKYFDKVSKDAIKDRFPPFRLFGGFNQDFNVVKGINVEQYVREHKEEYLELLRNFSYYKENMFSLLQHYKADLIDMPERWLTNIGRLLRVVDLYSENQDEFNYWVNIINKSLLDYKDMLKYPDLLDKVMKKLNQKDFAEFHKEVSVANTFTRRIDMLQAKLTGRITTEVEPDFWDKFK
jgi:hypothetical protein